MNQLSLRLRLALAGAVAVVLAIAAATVGIALLFGAHVERQAFAALSVQLDQVIAGLDRDPAGSLILVPQPTDPHFARPYGGLYWQVASADGLMRSRSLWDAELPLPVDDIADGAEHRHTIAGPGGQELIAVERSVTLPAHLGGARVRVAVAQDRAGLAAARAAFLGDLVPYAALLATGLILAGWGQIGIGLRPLKVIRDRVTAVRSGKTRRLGTAFPEEVRPLAAEVDALLDERDTDVARARARAGDLAHGFKTPLQALMGEAGRLREAGRTDSAETIEQIAGTMRRHVDREIARARAALGSGVARADVADVVAGLVRVVARTGNGARLDWDEAVPGGMLVSADPADLAEALGALVENAAAHARTEVRIDAERVGTRVTIRVADDGPGIAPERTRILMQRGARADTLGSGLGLAIAGDIAEALGGTLGLGPAPRGGLEARLDVPAAD